MAIKPTIPDIQGLQDPKAMDILKSIKLVIDGVTGRSPTLPKIKTLGSNPNFYGVTAKINEIVNRLQSDPDTAPPGGTNNQGAATTFISSIGGVSSVALSFTGGLISVAGSPITSSGTFAQTVAGTSGGVPYFDSTTSWASSGLLTQHGVLLGGGAGAAPAALGVAAANTFLAGVAASDPTFRAPVLASADFVNQGTTTTLLHGNAAGNPTFGAVSLTADVSGIAPPANGGTGVANNAASTLTISGNFATTATVTNTTSITLPTTGTLLSSTTPIVTSYTGPHAIGGATSSSTELLLTGTFVTGGTSVAGLNINATLTPAATGSAYGYIIGPIFTRSSAGGTHDMFVSTFIDVPSISAGTNAITNAATLIINGAPTEGSTVNAAIWVRSGLTKLDGAVSTKGQITSTLATGTAPFVVASTTQVANLNAATAGNASTVTTNANLTGPITSTGNATAIAAQTGTGSTFVVNTGPTISAPIFTGATTESRRKAVWQYTNWNPSDVAGTETAPSTTAAATQTAASYITSIAMATDTLTITFAKDGDYTVTLDMYLAGDAVVSTEIYFRHIIGGTATRYWTPTGMYNRLPVEASCVATRSVNINVTATATQTLTVRLFFAVTSAGTAGNYTASAAISAIYEGT